MAKQNLITQNPSLNNHSQLTAYRRNVSLTVFLDGRSVRFTESMSSCIIGDENEIDEVEQIISQLIEDCAKAVDNEQARLDKLMESNGIDEVPDYTDPITFNAKISSPQVGQFVGLVRKLDALMISMDTLWLSSVLSNKQRVDGNYAWQQRIIKLARRIIDIEIRARKSAQAKGKEAELNKRCLQPMTISLKRKQIPRGLSHTALIQ